MPLRQGADALQDSIDRAKSAGGDRKPANFLQWANGETKFVRFLSDISKIYVLNLHDWHPCADGKRRTFVCRKELGEACEICQTQPEARRREMGFGLAVEREAVRNDQGAVVGYQDKVTEVDGKVQPIVGIVRQAPTNFWIYVSGIAERFGSLRDYDIEILRKGDDKSTQYLAYNCPPVDIANMDERYANYVPDLAALLEGMASERYYAAHLRGERQEGGEAAAGATTAAAGATESGGTSLPQDGKTEFERLREEQQKIAAEQSTGQVYA